MSSSTSSSKEGNNELGGFIARLIAFLVLLALLIGISAFIAPHASRVDYYDALAAKHDRLANLKRPKVIIIGGSSATFDIDSEQLEKELCKPVVNMSIHAALGFGYMVREIEGKLNTGDIVLVCLEQDVISEPEKFNQVLAMAVDRYPKALQYVPKCYWPRTIMDAVTMRLQSGWANFEDPSRATKVDPIYRADAFNTYGDMVGYDYPVDKDTLPLEIQDLGDELIGEEFLPLWQQLTNGANRVGATIVLIWPAIARSSYDAQRDDALAREFRKLNIPIFGDPAECVYPDAEFLDTPYHLKLAGRKIRTEKLVQDLCGSGEITCCVRQ